MDATAESSGPSSRRARWWCYPLRATRPCSATAAEWRPDRGGVVRVSLLALPDDGIVVAGGEIAAADVAVAAAAVAAVVAAVVGDGVAAVAAAAFVA